MRSLFLAQGLIAVSLLTTAETVAQQKDTAGAGAAAESAVDSKPGDQIFGLTKVWPIRLLITPENWAKMQPVGGGFPRPGGPPGGGRPGSFGFDFEYVRATIEFDGKVLNDVGIRFKGNGTYMMSGQTDRRPLKLDFDRYVDDQKLDGLQQLNLHNNVMDPTHLRQPLAYRVFEEAGLPAPRTAFAEVTLTVGDDGEPKQLGFYTVVEEVDRSFLRRHFQNDKGMLLKPEGTMGLEYKGEDWAAYSWYEPKTKVRDVQAQRLISMTRLIHQADDETFQQRIGDFLDLDGFAGFLAANTLLSNMDSFLTQVHNYYVYLPTETDRFLLLPWDMDLAFGTFFLVGSVEQLQDLSIRHPHVGDHRIIDRLLAWNDFDKLYREHLGQLNEKCFSENGASRKTLHELETVLKDVLAREADRAARQAASQPAGPFGPFPGFSQQTSLETFMTRRHTSVKDQLAGKSDGQLARNGFGPPGGPGGPGARGGPGQELGPWPIFGPQIFKLGDVDTSGLLTADEFRELAKSWIASWDEDLNLQLDEKELRGGLNSVLTLPGPPGAPQPPAGFGPGVFLSRPFLTVTDSDSNGTASVTEWTTQFETWFMKWDSGNNGTLDEMKLIHGLSSAFAPPR